MTSIMVIDTETTGLDPETEKVVEVGAVEVVQKKVKWSIGRKFTSLVDPGIPIPAEAMAIHHLRDEEVRGANQIGPVLQLLNDQYGPFIPAAHNAAFDQKFLPSFSPDWICTYRCARHIWPDFPRHGNQFLRYQLKLLNEPDELAMPPHRARPDAYVSAHLLVRMLEEKTPEELLALTKAPILIKTVGFGKHFGQEWSKVPKDYLYWILRGKDFDPDVAYTAAYWSNKK